MTTRAMTDQPVGVTGLYECETCNGEGIANRVHLVEGDHAPSCVGHHTVGWMMVR